MAKLHFFYGAMGSGKSLDLIRANHNYRERGMNTLVFKPEIDTRNGTEKCLISSRAGDMQVSGQFIPSSPKNYQTFAKDLFAKLKKSDNKIHAIFIDEAQFLTKKQVEDFYQIVHDLKIPVLCYGLKNNFKAELFEGSKRLIELADDLQEVRAICHCGKRARQNARVVNGKLVKSGEEIVIGDNEEQNDVHYVSLCNECYFRGKIH